MPCGTVGASADQATIIFLEETTFNTAPAGNPTFFQLRFSSESLKQDTATSSPAEIDPGAQTTDIVRNSVGASGDICFSLSYQSSGATDLGADILWKAAFRHDSATWEARVAVTATTITFESSGTSGSGNPEILDSANGLAGFAVNAIISVQGSSVSTNNVFCKIIAVAAGALQVNPLSTSGDFTDDLTAGESVTVVQGPYIRNGTTCRSYWVEEEFTDLTNVFKNVGGSVIGGFSLNVPTEGDVTGSFSVLGAQETSAAATVGDGSPTASAASDIMSSVDNVQIFTENLAEFDILAYTLTGNNNLRQRRQVGSAFAVSIGTGRLELTGTLQAYFADTTFYDKYLNFTETQFQTVFYDNDSNVYVMDLPAVRLTAGQRLVTGTNTDIINDMGWTARRHPTQLYMIQLARFDAADTP